MNFILFKYNGINQCNISMTQVCSECVNLMFTLLYRKGFW